MGDEGDGLLTPGEQLVLSDRDAVSVLVEPTRARRTHIAAVGALSDISAALDREPQWPSNIARLAVTGGVFAPPTATGPHSRQRMTITSTSTPLRVCKL